MVGCTGYINLDVFNTLCLDPRLHRLDLTTFQTQFRKVSWILHSDRQHGFQPPPKTDFQALSGLLTKLKEANKKEEGKILDEINRNAIFKWESTWDLERNRPGMWTPLRSYQQNPPAILVSDDDHAEMRQKAKKRPAADTTPNSKSKAHLPNNKKRPAADPSPDFKTSKKRPRQRSPVRAPASGPQPEKNAAYEPRTPYFYNHVIEAAYKEWTSITTVKQQCLQDLQSAKEAEDAAVQKHTHGELVFEKLLETMVSDIHRLTVGAKKLKKKDQDTVDKLEIAKAELEATRQERAKQQDVYMEAFEQERRLKVDVSKLLRMMQESDYE
jgi:hypothetical protein